MGVVKTTKTIVGSAVLLGMGNSVVGSIPGGESVIPALGKAGNMLGVAGNVMIMNDAMKSMTTKKKKNGGY